MITMKTIQPRKQRKTQNNTPLHYRKQHTSIHLSPELRKQYQTRSFPAKKGDTVKILKGEQKGKEGTISKVNPPLIQIEGITRAKTDGTKVFKSIHHSNLMLTDIDLTDPKRKKTLNRKIKTGKPLKIKKKPKKKKEKKKSKSKEKSGKKKKKSESKKESKSKKKEKKEKKEKIPKTYYCTECEHNHRSSSNIGKEHLKYRGEEK